MRRRAFLTAAASGVGLAGCVSRPGAQSGEGSDRTAGTSTTPTDRRERDAGVEASFEVVDGHVPTEATAAARFDRNRVVVTGTMDPAGCGRPVLGSAAYDRANRTVRVAVAAESPYGETATVECGNASYDYRCVVSVPGPAPTAAAVVHDHRSGDDRRFALEKG